MKYLLIIAVFLCSCFAMSSCTESVVLQEEPTESGEIENSRRFIYLTSEEEALVKANNKFSLEVFQKLIENSDDNNVNLSPLCLSMALSLVANGAQGDTRAELLDVLGFGNLESANKFANRLAEELVAVDKKTTLNLANSIWLDNSVDADNDFVEMCRQNYDVDIFRCILSGDVGMSVINDWVSEKTNGLIPSLLDNPLPESVRYSLINALYFKSAWAKEFDKAFTKNAPFRTLDGSTVNVSMMNDSEMTGYVAYDTDGAYWLSLPFGNKAYSMVLVLPDDGVSSDRYIAGLSPEGVNNLLEARQMYACRVSLPKFRIECAYELTDVLEKLGVKEAFNGAADFSLICPGTCIGAVIQKTYIDIDEEGGTAAAATMTGGFTSPGPVSRADFIFDRPFAFMIIEESSSVILFMGRVGNP